MDNRMKGILSRDSGATDPILIIAGIAITLILLVGGTFAVAGFMNNARDLNAKADLDRVATAQSAAMAASDSYQSLANGPRVMEGKADASLATGGIGFVPSDGTTVVVAVGATGWAALAESSSGASFLRTSESNATIKVDAADIREDFLITALEGRLVDSNASAASTDNSQVVKFPSDVSVYNLAWTWVDVVWGLPADSRPEPGAPRPGSTPTPGDGGTTPTPGPSTPPEPTTPPAPVIPDPAPEPPLAEVTKPTFSAGDNVTIVSTKWTQASSADACALVTVKGTGGTTSTGVKWYVYADTSPLPFMGDLDISHYTFTDARYGVTLDGSQLRIEGTNTSTLSGTATIKKNEQKAFTLCNKVIPPTYTYNVDTQVTNDSIQSGWQKTVKVSLQGSEFYRSWKVRIDLADVASKWNGTSAITVAKPSMAKGTIEVKHLGGTTYEISGTGHNVDVKHNTPVEFRISAR